MRHATMRAVNVLLGGLGPPANYLESACGSSQGDPQSFKAYDALRLLDGLEPEGMPNCPRCAVILDAALEGRDVREAFRQAKR